MERLSKLVCENLMSRLWEGLWERIIMEEWEEGNKGSKGNRGKEWNDACLPARQGMMERFE